MDGDPHNEEGEQRSRVQRYYDLPRWKRDYIERLQPRDVEDDEAIRQLYRDSRALKRFWKLTLISAISLFTFFASGLGEYIVKLLSLIPKKPP